LSHLEADFMLLLVSGVLGLIPDDPVTGLDYIVSLNFRHIVKHKTIFETEVINTREGFKRVFIHTPAEVIEHEEDD